MALARRSSVALLSLLLPLLAGVPADDAVAADDDAITVAAAISLKDALREVATAYKTQTGRDVSFAFGSSGQLMAQVRNGAPIDAFVSAAAKQVDELAKDDLVDRATRRVVARNELVLIVRPDAASPPASFADLADPRKARRVALGEPRTVPAGQYAAQALKAMRIDDGLGGRTVYGTNVRQVLDYVRRGEVDAGIVYLTDAREAGDQVRVVATAGAATHDPIVYPAVVVSASPKRDAAKRFLDYLGSANARAVLAAKGFAPGGDATGDGKATAPAQ